MIPRAERLSAYAQSIVPDKANREPNDFYPTPYGATMALCLHQQFPGVLWEPARGTGEMEEVLRAASGAAIVRGSDLIAYGGYRGPTRNFFTPGDDYRNIDHVVTNPPFKLAKPFVDQGLKTVRPGGKVAVLCRLMFLEALSRHVWWKAAPLRQVLVFSDRVPFQRGRLVADDEQGGRMVPYAWYVFESGYAGTASLDWITYRGGCEAWAKIKLDRSVQQA
jgi:hypothetical protein